MIGLPEYGKLVLIKPLPGKKVVEEGQQNPYGMAHEWVPPEGVQRPWSAHWHFYLQDGAIEWPQPVTPVGEQQHE